MLTLKKVLESKYRTQVAAAKALRYSTPLLNKYIHGVINLSMVDAEHIATVVGMEWRYIKGRGVRFFPKGTFVLPVIPAAQVS